MRLLSWNIRNGGGRNRSKQIEFIRSRACDVVALQEVTPQSLRPLREALVEFLPHVVDSFEFVSRKAILKGPRRYGQLVASRWPLTPRDPKNFTAEPPLPWPERLLSVEITTENGPVDLHVTHVPPGASNGWVKIEHLEALYRGLACKSETPRILVGDFNTPKEEHADGRVETWGDRTPRWERWDAGERNILLGLGEFDLQDVFRALNGYTSTGVSFVLRRGRKEFARRFDHVFAAKSLQAISCEYHQKPREQGLSDHSPVEAVFGFDVALTAAHEPEMAAPLSPASPARVKLEWKRFEKLTAARDAYRKICCIYVHADSDGNAVRVGMASHGLGRRYHGGTGYAMDAAMHESKNSIFVAEVPEDLCSLVEATLIWNYRKRLLYNNVGKLHEPHALVDIEHAGDRPTTFPAVSRL